jgi:hypothetical protein
MGEQTRKGGEGVSRKEEGTKEISTNYLRPRLDGPES